MISHLAGNVVEASSGRVCVAMELGSGSIGYEVRVPESAEYGAIGVGSRVSLHIHTHVREDALDLYGFCTRAEKELFLTLLSVNGIGPKGALGILSGAAPGDLIGAIASGDKLFLTRIPGIGKKTAERLIVELADKPGLLRATGDLVSARASVAGASEAMQTARAALQGLGYRDNEAQAMLERVPAGARSAEEWVRLALQGQGRAE